MPRRGQQQGRLGGPDSLQAAGHSLRPGRVEAQVGAGQQVSGATAPGRRAAEPGPTSPPAGPSGGGRALPWAHLGQTETQPVDPGRVDPPRLGPAGWGRLSVRGRGSQCPGPGQAQPPHSPHPEDLGRPASSAGQAQRRWGGGGGGTPPRGPGGGGDAAGPGRESPRLRLWASCPRAHGWSERKSRSCFVEVPPLPPRQAPPVIVFLPQSQVTRPGPPLPLPHPPTVPHPGLPPPLCFRGGAVRPGLHTDALLSHIVGAPVGRSQPSAGAALPPWPHSQPHPRAPGGREIHGGLVWPNTHDLWGTVGLPGPPQAALPAPRPGWFLQGDPCLQPPAPLKVLRPLRVPGGLSRGRG